MPLANTSYFPGETDATYALYDFTTRAFIQPLPQYARNLQRESRIIIDSVEYEVEEVIHILNSRPDWPGPVPPQQDMGYDFVEVQVYASS